MNEKTRKWLKAAGVRAVKTVAPARPKAVTKHQSTNTSHQS